MNETFIADKNGYYGEFGGAFIPEMLRQNVESLSLNIIRSLNQLNS
jgi:tryptophan synthase beta chain